MESLDDPSGPNCRGSVFPMSDPNAESSIDVSMAIPGISDGVKGAWLLDAADEGLTAISDDMAPLCATSGAPLSTTMLQATSGNQVKIILAMNVNSKSKRKKNTRLWIRLFAGQQVRRLQSTILITFAAITA